MINYLYSLFDNTLGYNKYKEILEFIPNNENKIKELQIVDNELLDIVSNFCKNETSKKFIVSLSGGVDSMVLISIIHYLGYDVIGAHIDYNNRNETKLEEEFLEKWCELNGIRLYVKNIENMKRYNMKRSEYEMLTKNIRFDFYKEVMKKENVKLILLGHHKDDVIENIFTNTCRGRSILDLAGMKQKFTRNDVEIARPMISAFKDEIYNFAKEYEIIYFLDTTPNWSVRYKYRKHIYPLLEKTFTENIKNNLLEQSRQSSEWNELIKKEIINPFMSKISNNISNDEIHIEFNVEKYNKYPLSFWNEIFTTMFKELNLKAPSRKGVQTFMNSIIIKGVCNISLSNKCRCRVVNYNVKLSF